MLLYILPFIILLVVAIIFKKRQSDQQDQRSNKKAPAKKTTANKSKTASVDTPVSQQKASSTQEDDQSAHEVKPKLRNQIVELISSKNYSSAEAMINQALNENNQQHELYLLLLDVHQAQNDEFATKQLMDYLKSLQLHDILAKAQEKIKANQSKKKNNSTTPHTPVQLNTEEEKAVEVPKTQPEPVETEKKPQSTDLDFDKLVETPKKEEPKQQQKVEDVAPLEFTLDFDKPEKTETKEAPEPKAEEKAPKDVEHELDFAPTSEKPQEQAPQTEDKAPAQKSSAQEFNDLTFDFGIAEEQDNTRKTEDSESKQAQPQEEAPVIDLSEEMATSTPVAPVEEAKNDPLLVQFPELNDTHEASLNLELAEQYIQLGAYASARTLLESKDVEYSVEEQERAKKLLNQIAS